MALSIDGFMLRLLLDEITPEVKGLEIRAVTLRETLLEISLEGENAFRLCSMLSPDFSMICLRHGRVDRSAPRIERFESYLNGATIIGLSQIDLDRIVLIDAMTDDETLYHIYIELISPFPNVFLVDQENLLIEPLFSKALATKRRTLGRGLEYKPPEQEKIDPLEVDISKIQGLDILDPGASKIAGIGKLLSHEIKFRMESGLGFQGVFSTLLDQFRSKRIEPCIFEVSEQMSPKPPRLGIAWFKPTIPDVRKIQPSRSMNAAACNLLVSYLRTTTAERRKAEVVRSLRRRISKLEESLRTLPAPEFELEQAEKYRKFAELLLANLSRIRKGDEKAKVVDLYSPQGGEIEIPLSPELSPQLNAEAYFKKARKARNRASFAEKRQVELTKEITRLKDLLTKIETLPTESQELKRIIGSGKLKGEVELEAEEKIDEKAERLGIRPRRYIISDGWTVLVGRSAKENEILTHRYASPHDLWFHARQAQGSHVILKKGKTKRQVSKQAILEAAAIAAYYSKARTSKNVPVSYTEKRYVKKVRKAPPGLCTLLREEVVFVDPKLPS